MRVPDRRFALILTCLAALLLAGWAGVAGARAEPLWREAPDDMALGSPKAKVLIIEYASASCPHCARFNNEVFGAFKARYIDTGKVRYVLREYLTPPEDVASAGFLAARCGGKAHYFAILDQIFQHQEEIYRTGDVHGVLVRAAQTAGLSETQLNACIFDGKALGDLNDRVALYLRRDRIDSTPSFVINGRLLPPGEQTLASLEAAVAAASKAR